MKPDTVLVLLNEDHTGRDEMNLAGNPFALLQAASRSGQTFILNEWERTLPNGKVVKAIWNVKGDAVLGLPGPTEELLYLVLLQLTREAAGEGATSAEWPQRVTFSRYDVLGRMGMGHRKRDYEDLKDAFYRLQSVSIQAENSFHDPRTGSPHKAIGFSILNDFALNDEPPGRKSKTQITIPLFRSWFEWNRVVYESFLAGNVRSVALEFILSLDLPTSRRLFRFLDMMRGYNNYNKNEFAIGLFKLCDRLGMTSYKYASKIKEKLEPALDELVEREYLNSYKYEKGKSDELIVFQFGKVLEVGQGRGDQPIAPVLPKLPSKKPSKIDTEKTVTVREQLKLAGVAGLTPQELALRCHAIYLTLPEDERIELRDKARKSVEPAFWDRVEVPESPMSLGLWQLVAARYPERCE